MKFSLCGLAAVGLILVFGMSAKQSIAERQFSRQMVCVEEHAIYEKDGSSAGRYARCENYEAVCYTIGGLNGMGISCLRK